MMRAAILFLPLSALLVGASAPVLPGRPSIDASLAEARAEANDAADRLAKLEAAARKAGNQAERLRREQAVAAAAIEDAESRINAAAAEWRAARAGLVANEARMAERRAPLAALLSGLAMMERRPPLLVLADGAEADEIVRVKALLDTTQPVIAQRTSALRGELERQRRLVANASKARAQLASERRTLDERRIRFAALEAQARAEARDLGARSIVAGDRVLASNESIGEAASAAAARRLAMRNAAELVGLGLAPARPMAGDAPLPVSDFAYRMPVEGPLSTGVGSVNRAGIVSRGVRIDTARGVPVRAPADGKILFAAPYRGEDGIVIIDHGKGRTSLLLNVSADVERGSRVAIGQVIGRSLGPVGLELRDQGETKSPAFIAASSPPLSNAAKSR